MTIQEIESIVQSLLFASGNPLSVSQISDIIGVDAKTLKNIIEELSEKMKEQNCGINIVKLEDKYQFTTASSNADYVRALLDNRRNPMLSQAAMEVLSITAYNQPVTRAYIEQVRGVDCAAVLHNLIDKELIEEKGKLDAPGRPLLYGTTSNFLRVFGITSLADMPDLPEIKNQDPRQGELLPSDEGGDAAV